MVTFFFLKRYFIFRERRKEGESKGEKHQCVVISYMHPTGDMAGNPGMCPNWELNQQPFGSQASAQSTEPHQPGWVVIFLWSVIWCSFCLPEIASLESGEGGGVEPLGFFLSGVVGILGPGS